jgi:UTP--glucose-1-phosphate uridylyltransferase
VGDRPARQKLQALNSIREAANFAVVHQGQHLPYGNGSPLLAAKSFLSHDEPFVYMFGDDMVLSNTPCVKQLIDTFEKHQPGGVVAVQNVPREETSRYGIVELKPGSDPPEMKAVIEKPDPESAPSTLAQFGRFVFSGQVVDILEKLELGKDNELWLADAIDKLSQNQRVLVEEIKGTWYTTGDPLRFLIACIEYGLRDPEIGAELAEYLKSVNPACR